MKTDGVKRKKAYFKFGKETYLREDTIVGWSFLAPAAILGLIFVIGPILISLGYAFTDANLLRLDSVKFNGLVNFKRFFGDDTAKKAFKNTLEFVVKVVPLQMILALGLAVILDRQKRWSTFWRWVFFSPVMLSLAVTSFLWLNLLNPQTGLINVLLESISIAPQKFLKDPTQAMNILVLISAWQGAGYQMLIFLSALKNVPDELFEAAGIDGANWRQSFFSITMPLIKPTFSFVLITMLIGAFKLMVQPMIMTDGGPIDSTLTMSLYIYRQGITFRDVGYSSAIAMLFTIVIASVALTLRRVFREE